MVLQTSYSDPDEAQTFGAPELAVEELVNEPSQTVRSLPRPLFLDPSMRSPPQPRLSDLDAQSTADAVSGHEVGKVCSRARA